MSIARAAVTATLVFVAACSRATNRSSTVMTVPPVRVAVTSARAEHIVALNDAPEAARGSTLGVALNVAPAPWLELYGRSASGSLTAAANARGNHDLAELEAGASVLVLPWLAAIAGVEGWSYSGSLATQRWVALRTGGEARLDLANGAVRGVIRGTFLPKVTVDGLGKPTLAIGSATGVELRRSRFFASLLYSIDRFDFPAGADEKRSEQLSSLMLQAGWRFGRQPAVIPGQ